MHLIPRIPRTAVARERHASGGSNVKILTVMPLALRGSIPKANVARCRKLILKVEGEVANCLASPCGAYHEAVLQFAATPGYIRLSEPRAPL